MKQAGIVLDYVIEIKVDDDEIVRRISGRRVHPASGRVYHIEYNPPTQAGLDDETGDPLILRDDDQESIIRKRLDIYHEQTEPLVEYYHRWAEEHDIHSPAFHMISGEGTVDAIFERILNVIKE